MKSSKNSHYNICLETSNLLNNSWVKKEFTMEMIKYLEVNDNESTSYPNLWELVQKKNTVTDIFGITDKIRIRSIY